MDTVGNRGAHTEIQAIKIAVPTMTEWILDKAIQAHGAGGVSAGLPARTTVGVRAIAPAGRRTGRGPQAIPSPTAN
jgi:acyl-CoA dehydrogenase